MYYYLTNEREKEKLAQQRKVKHRNLIFQLLKNHGESSEVCLKPTQADRECLQQREGVLKVGVVAVLSDFSHLQ